MLCAALWLLELLVVASTLEDDLGAAVVCRQCLSVDQVVLYLPQLGWASSTGSLVTDTRSVEALW